MGNSAQSSNKNSGTLGLRDRKKARRRQEILACAEQLFTAQGIETTTMAAIAEAAGVSAPTVFNYFGSKDNLLSSLIFEGANSGREYSRNFQRQTDLSLSQAVCSFLSWLSGFTIEIAGKRVWRYAEAANIRRPNTEFEQQYARLDSDLLNELAAFLGDYRLEFRNGDTPDARFLAHLVFDRWTAHYLEFIKNDAMPLPQHITRMSQDIDRLLGLVLTEECIANPELITVQKRHPPRRASGV